MASSSTSQNDQNIPAQNAGTFPEMLVIQAFHIFTINSLSQAKLEGLLDEDTLASAEADVMICGPALCLFFAALRSKTTPPSVPIPSSATGTTAPVSLSAATCPPIFQPFFRLWAQAVPAIQALPSEAQHDLARIICDKSPLSQSQSSSTSNAGESSSSAPVHLMRIAADLRAVAIEITQRRTFQERYQNDLQSALDAGRTPSPGSEKRRVASFAPPPSYDEMLSQGSHSPHSSVHSSPQRPPASIPTTPSRLNAALPATPNVPVNTDGMQSLDGAVAQQPSQPSQSSSSHLTVNQASSSAGPSARTRSRPSSPTFLPPDAPAIILIRETLYAALGEVIATTPSIIPILKTDPPRAYFSTVALAILTVSTDCLTPTGGVLTPLGQELTLAECPPAYRPLMHELGGIGEHAKKIRDEDDERAMYLARSGSTEAFEPRMERLRSMLEKGVAIEEERYDAAIVSANASAAPTPIPAQPQPQVGASIAPTPPLPPRRKISPPAMPVAALPGSSTAPSMPIPTIPSTSSNAAATKTHMPNPSSLPRGPPFTTPAEDEQLLNPSASAAKPSGSGSNSNTSSPRSSGEHSRGSGLRNLLHKPKPASTTTTTTTSSSNSHPADPPPIAPKPSPPSSSSGRYAAPVTSPPSMPVPSNATNGVNMAGVGAGSIGISAAVTNAPRAALMMHQTSLSTTGNPYEQALGSGARIAGTDSGVVQPAPHSPPLAASSVTLPAPAPPVNPAPPVPTETANPRRSLDGSTVQFANRINALALNMTRLRMFQERQDMVFRILASVHD